MLQRVGIVASGLFVALLAAYGLSHLGGGETTRITDDVPDAGPPLLPGETAEEAAARIAREEAEILDREWPRHGLVTRTQLNIRAEHAAEALILGWLRIGSHVRVRGEPVRTDDCASGWVEIRPRGWVCTGAGLEVTDEPPAASSEIAPDLESRLPYAYYYVVERQVPEWFQLPSREDQRNAEAHALRYLEFLDAGDTRRAERLRAGELTGEPGAPPEVSRFLDHGFFVAVNGIEVRSRRRFVRTTRGTYVKESQLEERTGHSFAGVEIGGETGLSLPIAFAIRGTRALVRSTDGGVDRMTDDEAYPAIERLARVDWLRRERVGTESYHVIRMADGEERYVRDWMLAVAEGRERLAGVADDEPWVHVDVSSQTLVMYRGATPFYATLVSSGLEGHDTPEGEFTIHRKMVTDTMADPGSDLGDDRYRIEDVPWTQYFEGSIALHGAFWHAQYGIIHSHGCVNMSPADARFVFLHTWPEIPAGWHGVSTDRGTGFTGSRVVVTH